MIANSFHSPENCEQGSRQLFFVPDSDRMEQQQPLPAAGLLDMTAIPPAEDIDWDDDEESFTILDEPGLGVAVSLGPALHLVYLIWLASLFLSSVSV